MIVKPGEKFEFPLLMHEINVLTNWTILAVYHLREDTLIWTGNSLFHI